MPLKITDSGINKDVPNPKVVDGGIIKPLQKGLISDGGINKQVYQNIKTETILNQANHNEIVLSSNLFTNVMKLEFSILSKEAMTNGDSTSSYIDVYVDATKNIRFHYTYEKDGSYIFTPMIRKNNGQYIYFSSSSYGEYVVTLYVDKTNNKVKISERNDISKEYPLSDFFNPDVSIVKIIGQSNLWIATKLVITY